MANAQTDFAGSRPSLCIVACELAYLHKNGGIGTANWLTALNLADRGWKVHILYTGKIEHDDYVTNAIKTLNDKGIGLTLLPDVPLPEDLENYHHPVYYAMLSEHVHNALLPLHRKHKFDLIEFSEVIAMALRPVQSRMAGLDFTDVRVLNKLHSSTQWVRESNHWSAKHPFELHFDYLERYAFDHSDIQCSPCNYMFGYAKSNGWDVRPDAKVVPYFYPEPLDIGPVERQNGPPELVFFGRLETRKGLEVFVEAVKRIEDVKLTFLGKNNLLASGEDALPYLARSLEGREYQVFSNFNQEQAVRYLLSGRRLAVIPSLVDNQPNTVIECVVNRVPFVAARTGGIPEILATAHVSKPALFDPTPADLRRCLLEQLQAGVPVANTSEGFSIKEHNDRVASAYRDFLTHPIRVGAAPTTTPLVTVALDGIDASVEDQRGAVSAVLAQDYDNFELLVTGVDPAVAPGSDIVKVVPCEGESTPADRRERLAAASKGEFFLAISPGDRLSPSAVRLMTNALLRRDTLQIVTGYVRFTQERSQAYDRPTSGGRVFGCTHNVFGTGPAMVRTADIRADKIRLTDGDQIRTLHELSISALATPYTVDVVPEYVCTNKLRPKVTKDGAGRTPLTKRLMAECVRDGEMTLSERVAFWQLWEIERFTVARATQESKLLREQLGTLRHRLVDAIHPMMRVVLPSHGRKVIRTTLLGLNHFRKRITGKKAA